MIESALPRKIALLGATSQIARDLVLSFSAQGDVDLTLYARNPEAVTQWLISAGLSDRGYPVFGFGGFDAEKHFDAIINFVGSGNPVRTQLMGVSILDVTQEYDTLALDYLRWHPQCRYLFLSSGAAYGSSFNEPVTRDTPAIVPINNLSPQEWYGVAKMYAECRHRAHPELPIIDIRIFNYFSRGQDISARFLITDILRAIRDKTVLKTSPDYIVRDYLHPADFYKLVNALLYSPATNAVVDCYSRAPIDKPSLLTAMQEEFGLRYEITVASASVNATGNKTHYYSLNTRAADFGYRPNFASIEGVVKEAATILGLKEGRCK